MRGQKGSCTTAPRSHARNRLIRPFLCNCRSTDVALLNSTWLEGGFQINRYGLAAIPAARPFATASACPANYLAVKLTSLSAVRPARIHAGPPCGHPGVSTHSQRRGFAIRCRARQNRAEHGGGQDVNSQDIAAVASA
jgi:hypothetical protein